MSQLQPFRDDLLVGEVALVTGGGTGIGFAGCGVLVRLGCRGAGCGRGAAGVEEAAQKRGALAGGVGGRVAYRVCDVRQPAQIAALVAHVRSELGPVTLLVNNAGGQFPSPAEAISPNGFEAVVRNNLLGTFNVTRAVAEDCMLPARRGAIVN